MIRKLKSGEYRLYSRKHNPSTGKRRNLGTFRTLAHAINYIAADILQLDEPPFFAASLGCETYVAEVELCLTPGWEASGGIV